MSLIDARFADIWDFSNGNTWDFDSSGVLNQYGPNMPSQGYEFDSGSGLWVPAGRAFYGQITNAVRNPRCEGAAVGSPGTGPLNWTIPVGGSRQIVWQGIENGVPCFDVKCTGVAGGTTGVDALALNFSMDTAGTPTITGDVFSSSIFIKLVDGVLPGRVVLGTATTDSSTGTTDYKVITVINLGDDASRLKRYSTLPVVSKTGNLTSQQTLWVYTKGGDTLNFTMRFGAPVFSKTPFLPPVILPPVGAPAQSTRLGDNASMKAAAYAQTFGAGQRGTGIMQARVDAIPPAGSYAPLFCVGSDANNCLTLYVGADAKLHAKAIIGGTQLGEAVSAGTVTAGTAFAGGLRWSEAGYALVLNGADPVGVTATLPALFGLLPGRDYAGYYLNGRQRPTGFWGRLLSDSDLKAKCVVGGVYA